MRTRAATLWLLLAAVGLTSACHRDRCVSTCEANAKALGCDQPKGCKAQCEQLNAGPCKSEMKAFEACFLEEPSSHWGCESGVPFLKDDFCVKERERVGACLSHTPPPSK
ncbi:MAG TPA: hypothetical protein VHJ20_09730 [Polyangia bacterium]|nr:hypothetical protein [Polyangia bacterium]